MNLTITVDDDVLKRARRRALQEDTSVNAILRSYVEAYAGAEGQEQAAIADLIALSLETVAGRATSMSAELRFDGTTVLVYLFDTDTPVKQAVARELLAAGRFVLSTRARSELYVTVTRKLARPLDPARASRAVGDFCATPKRDVTARLVQAAIGRCTSTQLPYWDALIVETALEAGATSLLTEDLQHGQIIDTPRFHNPFLAS